MAMGSHHARQIAPAALIAAEVAILTIALWPALSGAEAERQTAPRITLTGPDCYAPAPGSVLRATVARVDGKLVADCSHHRGRAR